MAELRRTFLADNAQAPLIVFDIPLLFEKAGSHGLDAVLVAVELVLESGSLSAEHILNVVARLAATEPPPSVETHLSLKEAPVANTARYDRLRGDGAADDGDTTVEAGHEA